MRLRKLFNILIEIENFPTLARASALSRSWNIAFLVPDPFDLREDVGGLILH